jgi:hypothetical protein
MRRSTTSRPAFAGYASEYLFGVDQERRPGSYSQPWTNERDLRSQKPKMDFMVGDHAFSEHQYVGIRNLLLNLGATFPPPAHDIHTIPILGKEAGVGFRVVAVPSLLEACLHVTDSSFVLTLAGADRRQFWMHIAPLSLLLVAELLLGDGGNHTSRIFVDRFKLRSVADNHKIDLVCKMPAAGRYRECH